VLLLWRLLKRLAIPGAWLAAAIFALHPVNVEAVAWVTELKSILSLFFILLALLAWVEFIEEQTDRKWRWYGLALLFYALALTSKTTACSLPAVLLLVLWLKKMPINWPRLLHIVPFFIMGLGMGIVAMYWERYHIGTRGQAFSLGLPGRVLVASHAIWFYLGKLVWPVNLTFSYPKWTLHPDDLVAWGWLAACAGLGLAILFARRFAGRGLEVAMVFYVATLSPMLGFIMLYTFRYTFVADHYQYVAAIGPMALAAAGIVLLLKKANSPHEPSPHPDPLPSHPMGAEREQQADPICFMEVSKDPSGSGVLCEVFSWKSLLILLLCGALLLTLGILTWRQCGMYANEDTLWRTTIVRNPGSWMAYNNLGNILNEKHQFDEAIPLIQTAIRLKPDEALHHYNLAIALEGTGQLEEAIRQYEEAIRLKPDYVDAHCNLGGILCRTGHFEEGIGQLQAALRLDPDNAEAHNNLANALGQKGQLDAAIRQFQEALRLQPYSADTRVNLGTVLCRAGRIEDGINQFKEALRLNPHNAKAHDDLGIALSGKGQLDDAIRQFQEAIRLDTNYAKAYVNLGKALENKGRLDEAITQYQELVRLIPNDALAHYNLGKAYYGKRQIDDAIKQFQAALQFDPNDAEVCNDLGIALYVKGRLDEAIEQYQQAIRLRPAYAQAYYNLGNALYGKKLPDEAIRQLEEAVRLRPNYAAAYNSIGIIFAGQGQLAKATDAFQEAARLDPNDPQISSNLARTLQMKNGTNDVNAIKR
jgi:tetratricopeptide (TPR) repeat protein